MSTFKFFNIKALPKSGDHNDLIGKSGYRELIHEMHTKCVDGFKNSTILNSAYSLRNDFYVAVLSCHSTIEYSYGSFIKFDKPDGLYDTYTGEILSSVPANVSAHRYEFVFVFDHAVHVLGLQYISGRTPSPSVMESALKELLDPACADIFPGHYIEVTTITSDTSLEKALLDADGFKSADVVITMTNADDFINDEVRAAQEELNSLGISELHHRESSKDGVFKNITDRCKAYLQIARKNGNATLRYVQNKTGKIITYVMKDFPLSIRVNRSKKMPDAEFYAEVHKSLLEANRQAIK